MKHERCSAIKNDGTQCNGPALPSKTTCFAHSLTVEERQERARQAGKARSNRKRAEKHLEKAAMTTQEMIGLLSQGMQDVASGRLEPARLTAMAVAVKTIHQLTEADETAFRLAELEEKLPSGAADRERFRRMTHDAA